MKGGKKICERCHGNGYVRNINSYSRIFPWRVNSATIVDCPVCKSEGEINVSPRTNTTTGEQK